MLPFYMALVWFTSITMLFSGKYIITMNYVMHFFSFAFHVFFLSDNIVAGIADSRVPGFHSF